MIISILASHPPLYSYFEVGGILLFVLLAPIGCGWVLSRFAVNKESVPAGIWSLFCLVVPLSIATFQQKMPHLNVFDLVESSFTPPYTPIGVVSAWLALQICINAVTLQMKILRDVRTG